jgi:hypothetical protein
MSTEGGGRGTVGAGSGVVTLAALAMLSACGSPQNIVIEPPEDQLVEAVKAAWTSPGIPFLDGVASLDTISKVEATGKRSWAVTVPDPTALGGAYHWTLDLTRVQVLPVDSGRAFVQWLGERARQQGSGLFVPAGVATLLSEGRLLAVGDVEASFGRTDKAGHSTVRRVAYLEPAARPKETPRWVVQSEDRSSVVLRDMLDTVYDHMLNNDERVMTCMGEAEADAARDVTERNCITDALIRRFGGHLGASLPGLPASLQGIVKRLSGGS